MMASYPHIYTEHHCCNAMYYAKKSRRSCHCDKICGWFTKTV